MVEESIGSWRTDMKRKPFKVTPIGKIELKNDSTIYISNDPEDPIRGFPDRMWNVRCLGCDEEFHHTGFKSLSYQEYVKHFLECTKEKWS